MCHRAGSVTVLNVSHQLREVEEAVEAGEVLCTPQSLSDSNQAPPLLPLVCCHVDLVLKNLLRMSLERLVNSHISFVVYIFRSMFRTAIVAVLECCAESVASVLAG